MAEVGRFFDGVSYTEADQAEVQKRFRRNGVVLEAGNALAVSAGGAGVMTVIVQTGEAFVEGFHYKNDATKTLAIGNNLSGSTRIDRVVLHLDRSGNSVVAQILVGTPGAGAPALTQVAGGTWDLSLAQVTVASGATGILDANVADEHVAMAGNSYANRTHTIGQLLINPSFEDSTSIFATPKAATTVDSVMFGSWRFYKAHASDTFTAVLDQTTVDTAYGGTTSLKLVKTSTNGTGIVYQYVPARLNNAMRNRKVRHRIRVNAPSVGAIRPYINAPGIGTIFGPYNTRVNQWESLDVENTGIVAGAPYCGLEISAGFNNAAGLFVDNCQATLDEYFDDIPPILAPTRNYNGPACEMTLTSPNFQSVPSGGATLALATMTVDNDNMADVTNNRMIVRTPGLYSLEADVWSYTAGAAGNWGVSFQTTVGYPPFGGTIPYHAQYHNAATYSIIHLLDIVYFDGGAAVFVVVSPWSGQTVGIHYNGTYFRMIRMGD